MPSSFLVAVTLAFITSAAASCRNEDTKCLERMRRENEDILEMNARGYFGDAGAFPQATTLSPETRQQLNVRSTLEGAIAEGVRLWNSGDIQGCVDVYTKAVASCAEVEPVLEEAIRALEGQIHSERGWILRRAMDTVLERLSRPESSASSLPASWYDCNYKGFKSCVDDSVCKGDGGETVCAKSTVDHGKCSTDRATYCGSAATPAALQIVIEDVINRGVEMWNYGDVAGCTEAYKKVAERFAGAEPLLAAALKMAEDAPVDATSMSQGFILRRGLDAVLHRIATELRGGGNAKDVEEGMEETIRGAIMQGVPLWNQGEVAACTAIYKEAVERFADKEPLLAKAVSKAKLLVAKGCPSRRAPGTVYRKAMDAVLAALARSSKSMVPEVTSETVMMVSVINEAISTGLTMLNQGDVKGCTTVYRHVLQEFQREEPLFVEALQKGAKMSSNSQIQIFRRAMDASLRKCGTLTKSSAVPAYTFSASKVRLEQGSLDRDMATAIKAGSSMWNRGDIAGTTALYARLLEMYQDLVPTFAIALEDARYAPTDASRHSKGWLYRRAMDRVAKHGPDVDQEGKEGDRPDALLKILLSSLGVVLGVVLISSLVCCIRKRSRRTATGSQSAARSPRKGSVVPEAHVVDISVLPFFVQVEPAFVVTHREGVQEEAVLDSTVESAAKKPEGIAANSLVTG